MFYYLTSDWEDLINYVIVLLAENITLWIFCAGVDVTG